MLSKKDVQGIWLIVAVVSVLVIVLIAKLTLTGKARPGDDNCIKPVTANTVIVLDYTEKIPQQTIDEIASRAMAFIDDKVDENERVSVFTISDLSKQSLKPIVSICKPKEIGNRAIENVAAIKRNFRDRFETPLRNILRQEPGDSKESPIAQAITDISLTEHLRGDKNSLIVFSDMIENTSRFSLYSCDNKENLIDKFRDSRRGAQERPHFTNTHIALHLIPRLDLSASTLSCRDKLWVWFFGDNEGKSAALDLDYLPGGVAVQISKDGLQ